MRRTGAYDARAVGPKRHGRSKDSTLRPHLLPGFALAGGVLIAALIALLLIGGGGSDDTGPMPGATLPGAVRIFPGDGGAGHGGHKGHQHRDGSAAESQYGAGGDRGTVLGAP